MEERKYYADNIDGIRAKTRKYPGVRTPDDLYEVLSHIWCAETCATRMRDKWCKENKTLGQCSISSFVAQDIFGGKVYGIPLGDGNVHCFNVVGDGRFDLTIEQFKGKPLDYDDSTEQSRDEHFAKGDKKERYDLLVRKLNEYLACETPVEYQKSAAHGKKPGFNPFKR